MYVNKDGKLLNENFINEYNKNKFSFAILREYNFRLSHAELFDIHDIHIKSFQEKITKNSWEIRRRVSNSGCELLYCIVGVEKEIPTIKKVIPNPWVEISPIDFKYFKEPKFRDTIPRKLIEIESTSDDENDWKNRMIRCKKINNFDLKVIEELERFCANITGLKFYKNYPYIKIVFDNQSVKFDVFEKMKNTFKSDGDNINYFRRMLKWENVPLSEYDRFVEISHRI